MTAEIRVETLLPPAGTYRIHPGKSAVTYTGRHMFGMGKVLATFRINSGQFQVADPTIASTVTVSIDANSFTSGNAKRDKDVRSAALLNTAAYPAITFASSNLRWDRDHWLLSCAVTAHEVTVPVEVIIDRVTPEPHGIRVQAIAKHIDRYAFGVTGSKGMVGRHLDLNLDVYAAPDE